MATTSSHQAMEVFKKLPPLLSRFFKQYPPRPVKEYASKPTLTNALDRNPFMVATHPITKKVHEPKISLRKQSDLYKLAVEYGLEKTLPPMTKKFGSVKHATKRKMRGVVRPKLKKHERTAEERAAKRLQGINAADEIIVKKKGRKYARKLEKRSLPPKNLF
ncbi:hypothetical protein V1512DRAFT_253649 [Lipomyces arxii]|uniref:mitochondrial 54S ribosomal protein mL59 n=1 Tax=Lipomyces arxii TaxID=56418 RepID=UPI0034CF19C8